MISSSIVPPRMGRIGGAAWIAAAVVPLLALLVSFFVRGDRAFLLRDAIAVLLALALGGLAARGARLSFAGRPLAGAGLALPALHLAVGQVILLVESGSMDVAIVTMVAVGPLFLVYAALWMVPRTLVVLLVVLALDRLVPTASRRA